MHTDIMSGSGIPVSVCTPVRYGTVPVHTRRERLANHDTGSAGPGGEHGPHPGGAAVSGSLTRLAQQEDQLLNVRLPECPVLAVHEGDNIGQYATVK
jgi:hypothetical protein